jgi:uncharacterized membrane protein
MLAFSAMAAAAYIAVMYVTQGFAFGPYQMRIATALYALAYLFPFLVIPLALANSLSNLLMGGLGFFDIVGGFLVGVVTAGAVALIRRRGLPMWLVILPIALGPGLIVPLWLSHLTGFPYWTLVINITLPQSACGVIGYLFIQALSRRKVEHL